MTQCLLNAMITTTTATTNTNLSSQDHTKITSFVVAITGGCLLLLSRCWLFLLVRSWHRFLLFFLTCSCHLFICHLAFGRNGWINCRIRIPEKKHQTMIILTQYMISLCFGKRKRERENTYTQDLMIGIPGWMDEAIDILISSEACATWTAKKPWCE